MSTHRINPKAGYAKTADMQKGPNGRNLCRRCSVEVPKGKRTFCGPKCIEAWRLTTDPTFLRRMVKRRDKGKCRICGFDAELVKKALRELHRITWTDWSRDGGHGGVKELKRPLAEFEKALGLGHRVSLWDADHVVEVVKGGGECGLDNMQTLCLWCHREKTARLARERAEVRKVKEASEPQGV